MTAVKIIAGTALGVAAGYFFATRTREREETERVAELEERVAELEELLRQARQPSGGESWTRSIERLLEDGYEVLQTLVKSDDPGRISVSGFEVLSDEEKRELRFVLDKSEQQLLQDFSDRALPDLPDEFEYNHAVLEWVDDPNAYDFLTDEDKAAVWDFIEDLNRQLKEAG